MQKIHVVTEQNVYQLIMASSVNVPMALLEILIWNALELKCAKEIQNAIVMKSVLMENVLHHVIVVH